MLVGSTSVRCSIKSCAQRGFWDAVRSPCSSDRCKTTYTKIFKGQLDLLLALSHIGTVVVA
jgi:hypothetical protein